MDAQEITKALLNYTSQNSNFETSRDYISLSHCHLPVEEILQQYRNGFEDSLKIRLKCYKGYQMERDLLQRIKNVYGNRIKTGLEISALGGKVKGHPDFTFDDYPGDCKSVLMDDWIPNGRLPRKVYWQMQGYMLYSGTNKALIIYESRETGLLESFWIYPNRKIQEEINQKLMEVVKYAAQ